MNQFQYQFSLTESKKLKKLGYYYELCSESKMDHPIILGNVGVQEKKHEFIAKTMC